MHDFLTTNFKKAYKFYNWMETALISILNYNIVVTLYLIKDCYKLFHYSIKKMPILKKGNSI